MRLKEETAVVASPVGRQIIRTTQWLTNYEAQMTTDNSVVSNCTERHQQYITGNTLDNGHGGVTVADGNSNHPHGVTTLSANQLEALKTTGQLLISRDEETARNVVLMPLGCSTGDGLLITGEETQLANSPSAAAAVVAAAPAEDIDDEEEEEDSSEDSSAASTCSTSSDSALSERRRRMPLRRPRAGILNPNYPGFQRYANRLHLATQEYEEEDEEEEEEEVEEKAEEEGRRAANRNINNAQTDEANNNNNNTDADANTGQALNQLDGMVKRFDKSLSCEGVSVTLNIPPVVADAKERNVEEGGGGSKMADAHLSRTGDEVAMLRAAAEGGGGGGSAVGQRGAGAKEEEEEREATLDAPPIPPSQKALAPVWAQQVALRREQHGCRALANRRSVPEAKERSRRATEAASGGFDVYNIETAMPSIDLDAIESHLRAAEECRRRNDREEIRRRLAMGPEADDCYAPGRKPSLQSRLQSGMNLQICFMNETLSDGESPSGSDDSPTSPTLSSSLPSLPHPPPPTLPPPTSSDSSQTTNLCQPTPRTLSLKSSMMSSRGAPTSHSLPVGGVVGRWDILGSSGSEEQPLMVKWDGDDFFGRQARLQAEARVALAQAKEMAHMQMEVERQRLKANSPITQMVRSSLLKVGMVFPADRRRVSRQMLTEMNVAQLQVIVNDLHTQIEVLNEDLVKLLMERDDLHMEQDSMLVDIEDLTRYLGAKEKALKESGRDVGSTRGGEGGAAMGSLPSLPLIFRHNGGHSKLNQSIRPRIGGLLSKK